MKNILLLTCLFLAGCDTTNTPAPLPVTTGVTLEEGTPFIVGKINRSNLLTYEHSQWYKKEYDFFKLNQEWIAQMQPYTEGVSFQLFLGTWCEDSQREVPGMLKILDALGVQAQGNVFYAVDEDKRTLENYEEGLNIIQIPTLILFKEGKEMNRIVEFPVESLYKDIAKIFKNEAYQHAYYEVQNP